MSLYSYSTLALLLTCSWWFLIRSSNRTRNPPGPKPIPILGNVLDVPAEKLWVKYTEWRQKYGDIFYLNMLGVPVVVLGSHEVCHDLLDKRSAIYSDRPRAPMISELVSWHFNLVLLQYSSRWRKYRRIFNQHFNETASVNHRPIQERSVHGFLQNLLQDPDGFLNYIRFTFSVSILEVTYGLRAKNINDPYVEAAERAANVFLSSQPGTFLVDRFPILKYVPSWMPGAEFKRKAAIWRPIVQDMKNMAFNKAKRDIASGTAPPSIVSSLLSQFENELETEYDPAVKETTEEAIKGTLSTAHAAGADTTTASIQAFFLAMANYPKVQQMAQEELDKVVGNNRLPTFEDMPSLPYVNAIIKELLRWHCAAPLGAPHVAIEDDEYKGYIIRKGTLVFPNAWLLSHDPELYSNPHSFDPSRWLNETKEGREPNPNVPDPSFLFGFGRRVCPGRHFAESNLFISLSNILACFNILPLDSQGKPTDHIPEEFTDAITVFPVPFKVAITPRSQRVTELINETEIIDV